MLCLAVGIPVHEKSNDGRERVLRTQSAGEFGKQLESPMLRDVLKGRGEAQQKIGHAGEKVFVLCAKRCSKGRNHA